MIMLYAAGAAAIVVASLSLTTYVQTTRLDACKVEKKELKLNLDAAKQQAKNIKEAAERNQAKRLGDADEKYKADVAKLNADIEQLRKSRNSANSSVVPKAGNSKSTTVSKGQICFDRSEFDRAQSESEARIEELINEGAKVAVDLECGVNWINDISPQEEVTDVESSVLDSVINYIKK